MVRTPKYQTVSPRYTTGHSTSILYVETPTSRYFTVWYSQPSIVHLLYSVFTYWICQHHKIAEILDADNRDFLINLDLDGKRLKLYLTTDIRGCLASLTRFHTNSLCTWQTGITFADIPPGYNIESSILTGWPSDKFYWKSRYQLQTTRFKYVWVFLLYIQWSQKSVNVYVIMCRKYTEIVHLKFFVGFLT